MAVRMRNVLARPRVGVRGCHALAFIVYLQIAQVPLGTVNITLCNSVIIGVCMRI